MQQDQRPHAAGSYCQSKKPLELHQSLTCLVPVAPFPVAGRLWELQFELSSRLGGFFAALLYSALSSAELQVPGSLAATVVKWPVELAQDDSWRMESGTGTRFVCNRGGWSLCGIESATRNGCGIVARELWEPRDPVPLGA